MCCSKWWSALLALVVIVFTLWAPTDWTKWLVVIAGLIILYHAFMCKNCYCSEKPMSKPKRKR